MDGRYRVQELKADNLYHTIEGGVCETLKEAQRVRANYKLVARRVEQFNKKFNGPARLRMPVDYEKRRD